jgi:adenylate cyclase
LSKGGPPFRIEEIYRPAVERGGVYFDLQVVRLDEQGECLLLLTTTDATNKALQEFLLQQQRNENQLISAELTLVNERLGYILNRLVPSSVARRLMSNRSLPKPGGETAREATILFADMRDFTAYAEVYQPLDTLEFLNHYLAVVAEAILRHDGSLVQLVGDMVMGVFNIPEEQPDHPARAIRAALDIQASLRAFNQTADPRFPAVSFGVGICTGPVIAGYLGFQQRFRYAVVGDATNVAFHLSSIAAADHILLSESTILAAGDGFSAREKGDFQLKRRRKLVKVYELTAINGPGPEENPPAS